MSGAYDVHTHAMPLPVLRYLADRELADLSELASGVVRLDHRVSGLGRDDVPIPCPPEQYDAGARLARMDQEGVHRQAVSLPPFLTCSTARHEVFVREIVAVGNDALADFCASAPRRLTPLGTVPVGSRAAAAEAERCLRELGMPGLACGTRGLGRECDDPVNDRLWELLGQTRAFTLLHPSTAPGLDRLDRYWLPQLVGFPMETALAVSRLLLGGTLERHEPVLCLAHGGGCLPALRGRLDLGWRTKPAARVTRRPPSRGLDALYYDTAVFSASQLAALVADVGPRHVLLGTDTPFDLSDRTPLRTVDELGLGAEESALILHRNATRLLHPPPDAPPGHGGRRSVPTPAAATLPAPRGAIR
ncbi:amidohydrolase family protein [Streptomyces sp. B1866]|uniref:amidohydrolase family protein n=1 Tax=Streptomyces sp. B1866 TaxID=3075431 RepID=UPI00288D8AFD|nr:amidohydrolase family protein [Streptomyces sp. B1866]MDT3396530.1 amidohydrolase family protein [Streptomyces sp. B1866]